MRGRAKSERLSVFGDMRRRRSRGFSLIELIIFIVIAGIFVPLAYVAFTNAIKSAATPESIVRARAIAEQKMEALTKDKFDNLAIDNTSYTAVPGNTGYQWRWEVGYVTCNSPTNPTCQGFTNPTIVDATVTTNYKKVVVCVKDPSNTVYETRTIVTKRVADES
jgi:prepilin-type N-terminal cleavage/methylation domain-containing protein